MGQPPPRLATLDLVRGVAVLGILAINIHGFAGPTMAVLTPRAVHPPDLAGDLAFWIGLVLFEGKMRALFSIVFGASMIAFIDRAEQQGEDGQSMQLRRLLWLAPIGYLHYLLWWGDILLLYALAGVVALVMRQVRPRLVLLLALGIFAAWQADGMIAQWPSAQAEQTVRANTASPEQRRLIESADARQETANAREIAQARSFPAQLQWKLAEDPGYPLRIAIASLGETVPYMLIGMLLLRAGLFAGTWPRRHLLAASLISLGAGSVPTLAFAAWALQQGYPPQAMTLAISSALAFPHLLMAAGYLGLLVATTPRLDRTPVGMRLVAAGRMALTNYLATTLVMTAIFGGWGLGLFARVPVIWEPAFVVLGCAAMLAWSKPWLARFRLGPIEWLWRSLAEGRALPFRRRLAVAKDSH